MLIIFLRISARSVYTFPPNPKGNFLRHNATEYSPPPPSLALQHTHRSASRRPDTHRLNIKTLINWDWPTGRGLWWDCDLCINNNQVPSTGPNCDMTKE